MNGSLIPTSPRGGDVFLGLWWLVGDPLPFSHGGGAVFSFSLAPGLMVCCYSGCAMEHVTLLPRGGGLFVCANGGNGLVD